MSTLEAKTLHICVMSLTDKSRIEINPLWGRYVASKAQSSRIVEMRVSIAHFISPCLVDFACSHPLPKVLRFAELCCSIDRVFKRHHTEQKTVTKTSLVTRLEHSKAQSSRIVEMRVSTAHFISPCLVDFASQKQLSTVFRSLTPLPQLINISFFCRFCFF